MSGKVEAFKEYGAALTNDRWSWSAVTPNGRTVVLQLWEDKFDRNSRPVSYSEYGNPKLTHPRRRRPGNRERTEHLQWAREHCGGLFRVVLAKAEDLDAPTRRTQRAIADKSTVMHLVELDAKTGEFWAQEMAILDLAAIADFYQRECVESRVLPIVPTVSGSDEPPITLLDEWYTLIISEGIDRSMPAIYEWRIEGAGSYIGSTSGLSERLKAYGRNVANLMNGKPYRRGKPDRFRRIHRELERAHRDRRKITLIILENVDSADINRREAELIAERGSLNDPPFGWRAEI